MRIVEELHPRAVLLENVPDLSTWDDGTVLVGIRESLRALGYSTTVRIVNAFDHGVPQHRARLFLVGLISGKEFKWPEPGPVQYTLRHPSGDPTPSPLDVEVTRHLAECGRLLGIDVLDHVGIGDDGRFVSFKDRGITF